MSPVLGRGVRIQPRSVHGNLDENDAEVIECRIGYSDASLMIHLAKRIRGLE